MGLGIVSYERIGKRFSISDVLSDCVEVIRLFQESVAPIYRAAGADPQQGSIADEELASTSSKELLETAFSQSGMLTESAADIAYAFTKSLTDPVQTIAPWTLARAVLEPAALGLWLLDLSITATVRLQRSFAFRFEGLLQQQRFCRSVDQATIADAVGKRIADVERKAIAAGFKPLWDKGGKRPGIGLVMPNVTDIVAQTLSREWLYRILSGAAHGHFWALNNLSFELVASKGATFQTETRSGVKVHQMEKGLSPLNVQGLSAEVLRSLSMLIWARFRLFGWDRTSLEQLLEDSFDRMGIRNPSARFWRQ